MKVFIDGDSIIYKAGNAIEHTVFRIDYATGNKGFQEFNNKTELKDFLEDNGLYLSEFTFQTLKTIEPLANALQITKNYIQKIVNNLQAKVDIDRIYVFLGNDDIKVFRYNFYPEYKAGRAAKPHYYKEIKQYILNSKYRSDAKIDGRLVSYVEVDDVLSILGNKYARDCVLVHIDKDIDQVKGVHYNPDKNKWYGISKDTAYKNYLAQALIGDYTDNIPGAKGVGEKTILKSKLKAKETTREQANQIWTELVNKHTFDSVNSDLVYLLEEEDLEEMDLDMGMIGIEDV